jgi:ABC-type sulfate transport system permease subunit
MGRIIAWVIGGYLLMLLVVSVIALTVRALESITGHSINELGRPLAWIAIGLVFIVVTVYKLTALFGVFGGMWITRNVRQVNQYGVDRPSFPMKHPKI